MTYAHIIPQTQDVYADYSIEALQNDLYAMLKNSDYVVGDISDGFFEVWLKGSDSYAIMFENDRFSLYQDGSECHSWSQSPKEFMSNEKLFSLQGIAALVELASF